MKKREFLQNEQDAIRLVAKAGKTQNCFDIYVSYRQADWEYLMSHRRNPRLFELLKEAISLQSLRKETQKIVKDIARFPNNHMSFRHLGHKQRRVHSRRIDDSVRHLIDVTYEYMLYET